MHIFVNIGISMMDMPPGKPYVAEKPTKKRLGNDGRVTSVTLP